VSHELLHHVEPKLFFDLMHMFELFEFELSSLVSGTIIRGTLKAPNSQLVTPISIKLQRPDGHD
jgi:hypothetical protein